MNDNYPFKDISEVTKENVVLHKEWYHRNRNFFNKKYYYGIHKYCKIINVPYDYNKWVWEHQDEPTYKIKAPFNYDTFMWLTIENELQLSYERNSPKKVKVKPMNIDINKLELVWAYRKHVYRYVENEKVFYMDENGNLTEDLEKAKEIKTVELEPPTGSVQDFVDNGIYDFPKLTLAETALRCFLELCMLPAIKTMEYDLFLEHIIITCDYENEKHRVVGCSTMGDFWINKNPKCKLSDGYTNRVDINKCSNYQLEFKQIHYERGHKRNNANNG
jgi:hypothetical protein